MANETRPPPPSGRARRALVSEWFRYVWREDQHNLALIIGLSLLNAALITALPTLWRVIVDEVHASAEPASITTVGLWIIGVGVAQAVFYIALQGLRSVVNCRVEWRARRRVFDHLTTLSSTFYRRWRTGDLVTRLYDDAGDKISWFLCSGVFRALEAALIIIFLLGAMLWHDVGLTLWVVTPLPILIAAKAVVEDRLSARFEEVQRAISQINDELTVTFGGIRVVQASGLEGAMRERFATRIDEQRQAEVSAAKLQQVMSLLFGYGWQLALVALLLAGGARVVSGALTLGEFVTFEGYVMAMVWPMFDIGNFVSRYRLSGVALDRLQELLDADDVVDPGGDRLLTRFDIATQGLSYDAQDGARLLEDVDLTANAGDVLAIVGEVGAGKSVLLETLAGARRRAGGALRIGGEDPRDLSRSALRDALALVPQDPIILTGSLRQNILLGREVDPARLAMALEVSRLVQDMDAFSEGLETLVGERGVTLSGGQRQRVALARALVGAPRILLLDDVTAALDADTEAAFWSSLEAVLPEVTAIVVTHRVATMERATQILVMDQGRVVQRGSHDALMREDGAYQRIYGRVQVAAKVSGQQPIPSALRGAR